MLSTYLLRLRADSEPTYSSKKKIDLIQFGNRTRRPGSQNEKGGESSAKTRRFGDAHIAQEVNLRMKLASLTHPK